jgi:amino acid transporter
MSGESGASTDQVLVADQSDRQLHRALSFQDLFMISFGGVVGSGWLFAVAYSAFYAGPAAVISWIIAGIFMIAIALCFSETASAMHKTGQLVRGPLYSHGGFTGYIIGAAYILGSITVPAIEAEAVLTYSHTYLPSAVASNGLLTAEGVFLAVLLMVGFFFLNYFGVRFLGMFNSVVTWWKLIIPTLTVIFLFSVFHASNFSAGGFIPFGWPGVFVAIPAAGIGFAYLGFRGAAQFSGEAKNPQRDAPRAIILSITAAVILYVLLQVVFIGAINWTKAGIPVGAWASLPSSNLWTSPLYTEMKQAGVALLAGFASFLLADAIISPSGTGWVFLGEATRAVYGVGADGFFPRGLLSISRRTRIPWVALIVTTVIGAIFIAPFPAWFLFAEFITDAFTISLLMGPLTLFVLRWHAPKIPRPFKLPGALWIGGIAFIGGSLVIYWSEFAGLFYVLSILFLIIPIFWLFYAPRNLGISRTFCYVVGLGMIILTAIDTAYGYVYLYIGDIISLTPSVPTASATTLTNSFLLWYISLFLIVWVPVILTYRLTNPAGKKMITSGLWILVLLFTEIALSWFSVLGTVPYGPLPSPYIPFPWDTVAMTIIAAVIYAWALLSGYRTKDLVEVEELMSKPEAEQPKEQDLGLPTA